MGQRINKYPDEATPDVNDALLGSNSEGGKTKQFPIKDVLALQDTRYFPVLLSYKYAASTSSYNETTAGYFTANDNDTSLLTTLKVNKTNQNGEDVTDYLRTVAAQLVSATYDLNIKSTSTTSDYVRFSMATVVEELAHFTITGIIVGGSASGNFTDEDEYLMPDTMTSVDGSGGMKEADYVDAGGTGVVLKAQDSNTVNDKTVDKDVPFDALFTDTIYDDSWVQPEIDTKVEWVGEWVPRSDTNKYPPNSFATENNYAGVSLTETNEHLAPQNIGSPEYLFQGTLASTTLSAKTLTYGTRYVLDNAFSFSGYSLYETVGHEYKIYTVKDPLGSRIINNVINYTGTTDGLKEISIAETIVDAGVTFDLVVIETVPDLTPDITSLLYDYDTPNNTKVPSAGDIIHANSSPGVLRVAKVDDNANDNSVYLATLVAGDTITSQGVTWIIQSTTDQTTYVEFQILPETQLGSDGAYTFDFQITPSVSMDYYKDDGYWTATYPTNVFGLFIADGDYDTIIPNGNAYSVDVLVQSVTVSSEWGRLPTGSGGTTGGSTTPSIFESIQFDIVSPDLAHSEGKITWDPDTRTLQLFVDEPEVSLQIGRELWIRVFNNTGVTISNGKGCSVVSVNGDSVPRIDLTDVSSEDSARGYLGISTHDIEDQTYGYVTISGMVKGVDTSAFTGGESIWCSTTVPGDFQVTSPASPAWEVRAGGVMKAHATDGILFSEPRIMSNISSVVNFYNGSILEQHNVLVTSDGVNVTLSLEHFDGVSDLSVMFNGEYIIFPPTTITLLQGTDSVPERNYVYIPLTVDPGIVTISTTGFPTVGQYVPLADVMVPTAALVQTDGVYKMHAWTDHISGAGGQGHLSHINAWIRNNPAQWLSGGAYAQSSIENNYVSSINISYTLGAAMQLHKHAIKAFDTAGVDSIYIVNHPTTPYKKIANLNSADLNVYSDGSAIDSGDAYNLVVWVTVSEELKDCQMFINLPDEGYNDGNKALEDKENSTHYQIPIDYLGTGLLYSRIVLQNNGATIRQVTDGHEDLRGLVPSTGAGGSSGGGGVTTYLELSDIETPSYAGQGLKLQRVNVGETGIESASLAEVDTRTVTWAELVGLTRYAGDKFILSDSAYVGKIVLYSPNRFYWVDGSGDTNNVIIA